MRNRDFVRLAVALFLVLLSAPLCAEDANPASQGSLNLYFKVQLDNKLKFSALKPGDVVEGKLSRSVYSQDKELFPAGSRVRLTIDKMERRRRPPNDHWPWVVKAFTPRHEKYPAFRSAQVWSAEGEEIPLQVSMVSLRQEVEVTAAKGYNKRPPSFTANFEAAVMNGVGLSEGPGRVASISSSSMMTLAAGTQARVVLLDDISASRSRPGDTFQARLVEPVYSGSAVVLPEGTVFEGKVVRRVAPRMLSRPGSVLLSFTTVSNPGGTAEPIAASVAGVELDRRSHTRVDPEGQLQGDRPGKAWMMINLGVTGGIAKEVDDGTQLLIEAIVSSATDVSTAGAGRIAGVCVSGLFMLTRHGRDVVLPKLTEMEIVFDRPVALSTVQPIAVANEKR